jgi:5-formyltetrahydrofolate cyclo-ligase
MSRCPETEHDFRVDLIVTADEVTTCGAPRRPPDVMWNHLDQARIATIPVLAGLATERS